MESVNKYILASVLAVISLMAIYGTSASDQVTTWMDNAARGTSAQTDNAENKADEETLVSLNSTEAERANTDRQPIFLSQSPLERAGQIPQRQLPRDDARATGDTTLVGESDTETPVEPDPTTDTTTEETSGTGATAAENQTPTQTPVNALW